MGASAIVVFHETTLADADALQECRLKFYRGMNLDLQSTLQGYAGSNREAYKSCIEQGDEYNLADYYAAEARHFETLAASVLPDDPFEQMLLYRKATSRWTGEGCRNILDFETAGSERGLHKLRVLTREVD